MEELERRRDTSETVTRIGSIESDLKVIEADVGVIKTTVAVMNAQLLDQAKARKLLWGMASVLVVQLIGFVFGYGKLHQQFSSLNLTQLETNVSTALTVLGDHGTELANVRTENQRLRGSMDQLRAEFSDRLHTRTEDRFYRRDWEQGAKPWIEERFNNIDMRMQHLEEEHHQLLKGDGH